MVSQMIQTPAIEPKVAIRINGMPFGLLNADAETDAKGDLLAVTIDDDMEAPSMFTLKLVNRNLKRNKLTWVDSDWFDIGGSVEIGLCYEGTPETIFWGEITGLEPEFGQDEASVLIVRGYDRRHRLMRGRKTKSFTKMKDSAIASQIATSANLIPKTTDTKVAFEYVLQHNQTDLEFLQTRAKRIGYEVVVENRTLFFRPYQHQKAKVLTLTSKQDLFRFSPRLSSMNQVSETEARGWDPKRKQSIVGKVTSNEQLSPTMGGFTPGFKQAQTAFGQKASSVVVTEPVSSLAEAKQLAQAQFDDRALSYITGDGDCRGNPKIRAGRVIEIADIGKRFSGLYYVTSASHTYQKKGGYRTQFKVRRTAT